MAHESTYQPKPGMERWLDQRLPFLRISDDFLKFPTPRNLNYMWTFGGILAFCLMVQIATGIVLAMHYVPNEKMAFNSVEHIMRNVNWGWLLRYCHAVGASMFFLAVYLHMFRGLYYGSYKAPREVLWILGVLIFLLMMATGFMGYTLPWGQMSFWGATVITNLFSALDSIFPGLGTVIVQWLWGGYAVGDATLNRFFALHYLLPFAILGVVVLHVWALHVAGSNNPTGIEVKQGSDAIPFQPYITIKDGFALAVFSIVFAWFIFFAPNYMGHADNYVRANPLATPAHIVPEWYFLPFYAILRAVPSKLFGVLAMFSAIAVLFVVPWLDTSRIRSTKYRPLYRAFFWLFVATCIALGYLGSKPAEGAYVFWSRIFTTYYFIHFLGVLPILGLIETPRSMPGSISESVFGKIGGGATPGMATAHAAEKR